jgi:hypothetical protein
MDEGRLSGSEAGEVASGRFAQGTSNPVVPHISSILMRPTQPTDQCGKVVHFCSQTGFIPNGTMIKVVLWHADLFILCLLRRWFLSGHSVPHTVQ